MKKFWQFEQQRPASNRRQIPPPAPPISTEMLQPTVVFVALDLIDPNPWQK